MYKKTNPLECMNNLLRAIAAGNIDYFPGSELKGQRHAKKIACINSSIRVFKKYINKLASSGLVELSFEHGDKYVVTKKGYDYVNNYDEIRDFTTSFGLV